MIESHTIRIRYRKQPASLSVMRNDGYCWGRLITAGGEKLDVFTRRDHYEENDTDALEAFERAARNPRCVDKAEGWL